MAAGISSCISFAGISSNLCWTEHFKRAPQQENGSPTSPTVSMRSWGNWEMFQSRVPPGNHWQPQIRITPGRLIRWVNWVSGVGIAQALATGLLGAARGAAVRSTGTPEEHHGEKADLR